MAACRLLCGVLSAGESLGHINCHFHGLRHSHATFLLARGTNPKVVSERLGHCRAGFTVETYAHVHKGMQEEAAAKVDDALFAVTSGEKRH